MIQQDLSREDQRGCCDGAATNWVGRRQGGLGIAMLSISCGFGWLASTLSPWFWLASVLAVVYGGYQIISSIGCGLGAGDASAATSPATRTVFTPQQRRSRYQRGWCYGGVCMLIGAVTVMYTPIFWPLCTLVGWFAVSFWVAGRTGYAGCPEIGAIVSLFRRRPIATRCLPLDRCDATVADDR